MYQKPANFMRFNNVMHICASVLLLASSTSAASAGGIIASLPPLAGLTQLLAEAPQTTCLLPANADPHHFQIRPRQSEALHQADVLLRASADDGGWSGLQFHGQTVDLWNNENHAWLNPANVARALPRLAEAIHQPVDHHSEAEIQRMDAALVQALAPLKEHGVIMQHPAWEHVMEHYGIPVRAVLESEHHGHEHGPHMLEHALEILDQHPDSVLIASKGHSNRSLEWLQQHATTKPRIITLDPLGQCGMSWSELMQANIDQLTQIRHP